MGELQVLGHKIGVNEAEAALVRTRLGHPEETPALWDRALVLSPREPLRAVWYLALAWSALARRDYSAALNAAQRGRAANPTLPTAPACPGWAAGD